MRAPRGHAYGSLKALLCDSVPPAGSFMHAPLQPSLEILEQLISESMFLQTWKINKAISGLGAMLQLMGDNQGTTIPG